MSENPMRANWRKRVIPWLPSRSQEIFVIETAGLRTAAAATIPFILGQILGHPTQGLMIGLGGLYGAMADKPGATWRTLFLTAACVSAAALAGALVGETPIYVAVALMFLVAFTLGMIGVRGDVPANVGYITTLVFAVTQGLPAHMREARIHLVEFGLGGIWAALLTLLLWRLRRRIGEGAETADTLSEPSPTWLAALQESLRARTPVFWHSLRLAVASAIAVAIYRTLKLEHGYWLLLTTLVILKPDYTATRQRAAERMIGSLVGGALSMLLAAEIRNIFLMDFLLVVFAILAYSHSPVNYGLFTLFLTPFVVLMINIAVPGDWQIAITRILNTFAGGALALVIAFLLRPHDAVSKEASAS